MRSASVDGTDPWQRFLDHYHQQYAGITETVLDRADRSPYGWLATTVEDTVEHTIEHTIGNRESGGPIIDLGCGSAPTQPLLRSVSAQRGPWLGIDSSTAELRLAAAAGRGPLVRARAEALPLADRSIAVVCAAMSLQVLTPLDRVLAEIRRVLRPDGALAALVPATGGGPRAVLGWGRVFAALEIRSLSWPNPGIVTAPTTLLAEHGLKIISDQRRTFRLDLIGPGDTDLIIKSLYLPDHAAADLASARRRPRRLAPHGLRLPFRLRLIVAVAAQ